MAGYDPKDPHRYDDMLYMPHHVSPVHPPLSSNSRAAQFSPFAALTGYEDQVASAHHRRVDRIILSEEEREVVNEVLSSLCKHDQVKVMFFHEDYGTDGSGGMAEGEYLEVTGEVLKIEPTEHLLRIRDGEKSMDIRHEDILHLYRMSDPACQDPVFSR